MKLKEERRGRMEERKRETKTHNNIKKKGT